MTRRHLVPAGVRTGVTPIASRPSQDPDAYGTASRSKTDDPWAGIDLPSSYSINRDGVFITETGSRISGPAWVPASTFDPIVGAHGVVIRWLDLHGTQREIAVTRDELHLYGGTLPARLACGGLFISPGDERKLLRYLAQFDVQTLPRWNSACSLGWLEDPDGALAYMLPAPAGLISAAGHPVVIFQPERESPSSSSLYSRGTLDDWNRLIVSVCCPNPLLLFATLVGLSGPLLRFAEMESGGFHFYGRSSHGKTTAAQVAASVWGNGADPAEAPERAFIQKWNSTANALEALLTAHNDSLLVLDEIHTCDAKSFSTVVYNMSGGRGRQALDRDRQLRRNRKWRAMYFSTGEISVLRRLQADGREIHAGQLIRFIDIPIDGGIITTANGDGAASVADRLKAGCSRHFGVAGPAFVRALVAEYSDARALAATVKSKLENYAATLTPKDAAPEQRRAIKRFALLMVAGELAITLGVLSNSTASDVETAVRTAMRAWHADGTNISDRLRGAINVRGFIERNESRFQALGTDSGQVPRDRAGFVGWDHAAGAHAFLFTADGFAEACGGQDPRETARELHARGLLVAREPDRYTEKRELGCGRHRVYVVLAALLNLDV